MENIKEKNKLFAEFIGTELLKDLLSDNKGFINIDIDIYEQCKFDSDWNWLMKVVEKIESIEDGIYQVDILQEGCKILKRCSLLIDKTVSKLEPDTTKIKSVNLACLEFIKYYKEAKSNEKIEKVREAIKERYGDIKTFTEYFSENRETVLVNLCDDLNDEFSELELLEIIKHQI